MLDIKNYKLQKSQVTIIVLILIITALIVFGYFYLMKVSPISTMNFTSLEDQEMPTQKFVINGTDKEPLNKVLGVAADNDNKRVIVADSGNSRIGIFDANGKLIKYFGKPGKGDGDFNYPTSVAVSPDSDIYVVDFNNRRIQVFDQDGKLRFKISEENSGGGPFIPVVVTCDEEGNLYVSDIGKQQVRIFDSQGKPKGTIGQGGNQDGQISYANGLYVDNRNGWLYVADSNNGRVQVFTLAGKFLKKLDRNLGFALPRGIIYDNNHERLYVVDTLLHQVKVFGAGLKPIGVFGGQGNGAGQFSFPNAMAEDDRGNLYVADRENNRVVVYGY